MSETPISPPPAYVEYPRANMPTVYGTSEKLSRLYRGYHGMSYTFLFIFLAIVALIIGSQNVSSRGIEPVGYFCLFMTLLAYVIAFFFGIRSGIDIGYASGWSPAFGPILGFFAPIAGLIVIVILQQLALAEMKRYGSRSGSFTGIRGTVVKARIAELVAIEGQSQPVYFPD